MCLETLHALMVVDPDAKGKDFVDPVFGVVFFVFAGDGFASRETVGALMLVCRNMDEFEVEKEDCCDPSVHGSVWLHVRITEHALDVLGIHLDD